MLIITGSKTAVLPVVVVVAGEKVNLEVSCQCGPAREGKECYL